MEKPEVTEGCVIPYSEFVKGLSICINECPLYLICKYAVDAI